MGDEAQVAKKHACTDHFKKWLQSPASGCGFASSLARRGRIVFYSPTSFGRSDLSAIDGLIAGAAAEGKSFILLFPLIRSAYALAKMLTVFDGSRRWVVERIAWRKHKRQDAALVSVSWLNDADNRMSVMGFGPLLAMPATRRAPYVALAIWGGGQENPQRNKRWPKKRNDVGITDAPTGLSDDDHDVLWNESTADVETILKDPPEDAVHLRKVAFCLPRGAMALAWKKK